MTVLVIVGDVDAKQTLQTAAKLFGDIPAKAQPPRNKLTPNPICASLLQSKLLLRSHISR